MILAVDTTTAGEELLADVDLTCDDTTTVQESRAGGAEVLVEGDKMMESIRSGESNGPVYTSHY